MNKILIATTLLLSALSTQAQTDQSAGFVRRCVVEEYTGTWCGNCPRGIVGLSRLAEDFGDRFIGIAIHTGDSEPMVIPTYPSLVPGAGGIPAFAEMQNVTPFIPSLEKSFSDKSSI